MTTPTSARLAIALTITVVSALTSAAFAQATVEELAQFNHDSVLVKRCADMGEKAAAMVPVCKPYIAPPKPIAMEMDPARLAKRPPVDVEPVFEVQSAWGDPEDPTIEVAINDAIRIMKKGDSYMGWKLASLTPYTAVFHGPKGNDKTINFRTRSARASFPMATMQGMSVGAPLPMVGGAQGPVGLPGQR